MSNGKVQCNACKNDVTPRLWHHNASSIIFKRKNEHICPICGVTMYTSGGGITVLVWILAILLLAPMILQIVTLPFISFFQYFGFSRVYAGNITFFLFIGIGIYLFRYRYMKKKRNKQNSSD